MLQMYYMIDRTNSDIIVTDHFFFSFFFTRATTVTIVTGYYRVIVSVTFTYDAMLEEVVLIVCCICKSLCLLRAAV